MIFLIAQAQQEVPLWLTEVAFESEGGQLPVNTQKVGLEINCKSWLLELFLSLKLSLVLYIQSNGTETGLIVIVSLFLVVHLQRIHYY